MDKLVRVFDVLSVFAKNATKNILESVSSQESFPENLVLIRN